MRNRDGVRQVPQHGDAAENPLRDHGGERQITKLSHPPPRLRAGEPDRQNDDQESHCACDEPVKMLVEDSAHHLADRKRPHEPAVGVRPVRHREAGTGAGDEPARENQNSGGSGNDGSEDWEH